MDARDTYDKKVFIGYLPNAFESLLLKCGVWMDSVPSMLSEHVPLPQLFFGLLGVPSKEISI